MVRRGYRLSALLVLILTLAVQAQGNRYALLIGGLGGSPDYTDQFVTHLFETQKALVDRFGFDAQRITILGEPAIQDRSFVDEVSNEDNIRSAFARLAQRMQAQDQVMIVLFGHGSYNNEQAYLNIPRRDLSDQDYADLVDTLPAQRIIFINTASASGPFIESLSGRGRIIITATRRGSQRNETQFPQYLVEALQSGAADLDKDGNLSVRELFVYASQQTERFYEDGGHLATEHALMEDSGDGAGHRVEELEAAGEGNLASITLLGRSMAQWANVSPEEQEAVSQILGQRTQFEQQIAELKSRKSSMNEVDYYAELEVLFVRLARLNETLDAQRDNP